MPQTLSGSNVGLAETPEVPVCRGLLKGSADELGPVLVLPYEHAGVVAGQGTVAVELFARVDNLPCWSRSAGRFGGGCALVASVLSPNMEIAGVESAVGNDTKLPQRRSVELRIPLPHTIADGIATDRPKIQRSMRFVVERATTVIEPAAAARRRSPQWAVRQVPTGGRRLSGGNSDAAAFRALITPGSRGLNALCKESSLPTAALSTKIIHPLRRQTSRRVQGARCGVAVQILGRCAAGLIDYPAIAQSRQWCRWLNMKVSDALSL